MARVTVEDCVTKIPNRFKLVMIAAQRSRELSVGGELTVERDNDKNPVVALREIADETISIDELETSLVQGLQKNIDVDEPIDEAEEMLVVEEALGNLAALEAAADDSDSPLKAAAFEDEADAEDDDEEDTAAADPDEAPDEAPEED